MQLSDILLQKTLQGHVGGVYCLAHSLGENQFYSGGSDGHLVTWNPLHSNTGKVIAKMEDAVFSIHADLTSGNIYVGTKSGFLFKVNPDENPSARKMVFHQSSIYSLLKVEEYLYAFSADGVISVWSENMDLIKAIQVGSHKLRKAIYIKEMDKIIFSDGSGSLYSLDATNHILKKEMTIDGIRMAFALAFSPVNNTLFVGGMDALIHSFDLPSFLKKDEAIKAHWYTVNDLVVLDPYLWLASASRDKSIRIWNQSGLQLLKDLSPSKEGSHQFSVNSLLWLKGSEILISASDDGTIKCWKPIFKNDTNG